jgi:hypothetical protein
MIVRNNRVIYPSVRVREYIRNGNALALDWKFGLISIEQHQQAGRRSRVNMVNKCVNFDDFGFAFPTRTRWNMTSAFTGLSVWYREGLEC